MVLALRNMKHRIILVLSVLICLLMVGTVQASGLEGLSFTIAADPDTFIAPGKTNITVRLANSGQADISSPLALYDPDDKLVTSFFDGGSLSGLKIGETQTWTGSYDVKQEQLDAQKLIFTVKTNIVDGEGNVASLSLPAQAGLTFIGEKVDLQVKRTISPEVVRKNSPVKVIYEFVNNGNVKLKDIRVREHSSVSGKTQTIKTLEPGNSASITFESKGATNDLTSHPNITYQKEGSKETLRSTLDKFIIAAARPNLQLSLAAEPENVKIGEKTKLILTMQNDGNVAYSNVTVTDKVLGEVLTGIEIPAKQKVVREVEVSMQKTETFKFSLKLPDNTGIEQTETTNEIKVSAYDPKQMAHMTLDLSSSQDSIDTIPGIIDFNVVVTNNSDFEVKGAKLKYGENTVYTVASLKPGESVSVKRRYELSQGGKIQFTLEALDGQKNVQTFKSNELQISYIPATPKPTEEVIATVKPVVTYTPVPLDLKTDLNKGSDALLIAAIAVAGLFGVAFALFIASSIARASKAKQSDNAYDHMPLEQKRDYLDPDTYGETEEGTELEPLFEEKHDTELPSDKYIKEESAKEPEKPEAPVEEPEEPMDELSQDGAYRMIREDKKTPESESRNRRSRRSSKHNN
ncbi:MAG: hypothetical protein Q4E07_03085 [Eubacteriales bacterium]|nr:hypothetical protein [Eubacteriales bacterium]